MILGGIIGALVIGLMVVVYLISSNSSITNPPVSTAPTSVAGNTDTGTDTKVETDPVSEAGEPPRMSLEDFKAVYDNPATRPIILDVRAKESYDEGHIEGSISFPEADVDARVGELPKDKLIVAYCQ